MQKKYFYLLVSGIIFIFFEILFSVSVFAQEDMEENETGESILAREQFIFLRRAGGPGLLLPPNAYPDALIQKSKMLNDRDNLSSPTRLVNWVSINPIGMFYNVTGNNYVSGRTNSIAFHPTDVNTIYIAAAQGGVWKTTNGGVNWYALTDNLATLACGDVIVVQSNPNILYLGTGELNYSGDSQYGNGIYKSTNAGVTWFQVAPSSLVGTRCSQMAVDPNNINIVYMAGNLGVFKSTDAGTSWTNTNSGTNSNCLLLHPNNSQIIYITTGGTNAGQIKKSTDAGTTWQTLSSGLPGSMGRIQLAIARSNPSTVYASISNSSGALVGLYRSTDDGSNWTAQATSPNYLGSQGWYDNAIAVNPSDPNVVIVGGLDVYASTTGGTSLVQKSSWSTSNTNMFCHADIHRLEYNGSVLWCVSDGGVYKSTNDGTTWTDLNQTLSTLQYQSADYNPQNTATFHGGTQDNNKQYTTNTGAMWIQRSTGDGGYTIVDPVNPTYIYGQYVNGSIQRSANNGTSYTNITPIGSSGGLFYNPYEMAPGDHNTIVFGRADIWKTTNAQSATTSSGWTQIATTTVVGGSVSAIGISWTDINKIYIGTSNGRILVTTDNGANWSTQTGYAYVSDFVVDNTNDNICYATIGGTGGTHVLKTTNGGINWNNITNNIPNIAANCVSLRTAPVRTLFVATDIGVFSSTDEGTNWISFNSGLPAVEVYDMKYKQNIGLILVATHGRGCWTFDLNSASGIDPFGHIPSSYKLYQNYPNPFNPSTIIEFDIKNYGYVKLQIFDVSGKLVDELVNGKLNPGHYQKTWNAENLSSGIYYSKLVVNGYRSTKKMLFVK
jgi:photosystem II stability/assembly factor-like uncharacterized protein